MGQVVNLPLSRGASGQVRQSSAASPRELPRVRLLATLTQLSQTSAVLLQAPAGFGKTTLLEQYASERAANGARIAWLTLNEQDRQARHLAARLAQLLPGMAVDSSFAAVLWPEPPTDTQTAPALILDCAERISGSEGEKLLLHLIEQRRRAPQILIASRRALTAGVTRLRLKGELAALTVEELRFAVEETRQAFLQLGVEPTDEQIAAFQRISEGWPAAVRMAWLALQSGRADLEALTHGDPSAWLDLHTYLSEEFLAPQSPALRSFLLQTAPLGRFTADLAAAVADMAAVDPLIEELELAGVVAAETGSPPQRWLRYQPLFARCFEHLLASEDPQRLVSIHQAAMRWHQKSGLLSDAIRHAFAAGDQHAAGDLLEIASRERRRLGRVASDPKWSQSLSSEAFDKHPRLHVEAACSFAAGFELEAARVHLATARQHFSDLDPVVRDDLFAVDCMMAVYGDRPEVCVEIAERGLRECTAGDPYTLATMRLVAATGWLARGALDKSRRLALQARADSERAGSAFGQAIACGHLGLAHAVEGSLVQAVQSWHEAEDIIRRDATEPEIVKVAIGYLPEAYYEWNELEKAQQYLDRCLQGSMRLVIPDMLLSIHLTAARLAMARQRSDAALAVLERAEATGLRHNWPRFVQAVGWERVRVALARKRFDEARRLRGRLQGPQGYAELPGILPHAVETEANLVGELRYQVLVEPNRYALAKLRRASARAVAGNRIMRAVKLLTIEAICRDVLGDRAASLRVMQRALELGAPGRLIRTIVDEGPLAVSLAHIARERETDAGSTLVREYLDAVLHAGGVASPIVNDKPALTEPLSRREIEVLSLLVHGCSNAEAARRVFLSQNTIKWHLQNIYAKLGVRNRTGAIAAARRLDVVR